MAVQINTYGGLKAGVLAWLARSGDSLLDSRFDDFLLNCERRIYYGFAADDPANPLRSDPLRIVDLETVDPTFALSAVTPQPATFLELISAQLNSPNAPLQIVAQRTIDGYASSTPSQPRLIAVSGTNFRVFPDPDMGSYTATLRYYQKLATPAGATVNAILTGSPDVSLGLVRLFLAWVVAADHWSVFVLRSHSVFLDDVYKFGFNSGYAVMFFYVVSGFLITYTLSRNYDRDLHGTFKFYKNRFIRIFSLYWPLVVLTFLIFSWAWERFLAASLPDKLTGIFLLGMDWRVAFASYPETHFDAAIGGLHQAWTLGAELTFYLLAPLLMRSWKIGAALLAASFGLRATFVIVLGDDLHDVWTYHFAATTFGFFMLGHLICLAHWRWRPLSQPLIGGALLVCSFATMTFAGTYDSYDTVRFWGSVLFFAASLPGLFEATKSMRWLNLVGDLSYPIYLVHTSILILLGPLLIDFALPLALLPPVEAGYVAIAAFLAATTLAALLIHKVVEVPVAHAMHRLAGRPRLRPLL